MLKRNKCCVCNKKMEASGHCRSCQTVQDNIRFLHDKYPGVRDPRRDVREQLIAQHTARVEAELARMEE